MSFGYVPRPMFLWVKRLPLKPEVRAAVIGRDGNRCRYCGSDEDPFVIDHILPVAMGGADALDNLALVCRPCNRAKGWKRLIDFLSWREPAVSWRDL